MKKLLFFSLSAALAFTACTKIDSITPSAEGEVTFTSTINAASTKVIDNEFETGDAISVFALSGSTVAADNVKYVMSGGIFSSDDPIATSSDALSFVAIYPYAEDMATETSFSVAADQSSDDAFEASDLLSAVTAATTSSCPELTFDHALSAIEVNIETTNEVVDVIINAAISVDCDFVNGAFVATGDAVAVTPLALDETSSIGVVAPQTIAKGAMLLQATVNGYDYDWFVGEEIVLESGYKYVCSVVVTDTNVTFSGAIEPWTQGGLIDTGENDETFGYYTLAEISADNIPLESTWVITDETASAATEFAGLNAAIVAIADSGREIKLEFSNITSLPNYTIFGKTGTSSSIASQALVSVSAPECLTIGNYAFRYGYGLKTISFPKVTSTGLYAFSNCVLEEVDMPSLETVGNYTFYASKTLKSIELPEALSLGQYAFGNSTVIESISAPKATSALFGCFYGCTLLETVDLPSLVTAGTSETSSTLFYQCTALESIDLPNVETLGKWTFSGCTNLVSVNIPKVTTMGYAAFLNCTSLESVEAPELVTIYGAVFSGSGVKSFTLPATLESIVYNPFITSYNMVEVVCETDKFVFDAEQQVLMDADKTTVVSALLGKGLTEVVLPSSVTTLAQYSFQDHASLESMTAPGLTTVDAGAMWRCTALKELRWSTDSGVVLSGFTKSALYNSSMEETDLYIGSANSAAVDGNTIDLTTETLTFKSITIVDEDDNGNEDDTTSDNPTFDLADISTNGSDIEGDTWVITNTSGTTNDFANLRAALKTAGRLIAIELPNFEGELPADGFSEASWLGSLSAPLVTSTDMFAVAYCPYLTSISLPSLASGYMYTVYNCPSLVEATLCVNSSVSSFDSSFFQGTTVVGNVTLYTGPSSVTGCSVSGSIWCGITFKEVIIVE